MCKVFNLVLSQHRVFDRMSDFVGGIRECGVTGGALAAAAAAASWLAGPTCQAAVVSSPRKVHSN